MKHFIAAAIATTLAAPAFAASTTTVDLTGWGENGFQGNNGAGSWTVQGADDDSVTQSTNGQPTVFFESGSNAQGTVLGGTIRVNTASDDDYIGFVLGYNADEFNSTNADFWLIDWKKGDQNVAVEGLSLSHVTGNMQAANTNDFWQHVGTVSEKDRATTLGNQGWNDGTTYTFDLTFTTSLIEVKVNNVSQLSWTSAQNGAAFSDGAFGFYNYSQGNVTYAGITTAIAPTVPVPASLPLLAAGFGAMTLLRRKRKAA